MTSRRFAIWACVIAFTLVTPSGLFAHGGGLDGNGCHRNKKEGNYHCHKGPDAGKTFPSKEAYEKSLGKKK